MTKSRDTGKSFRSQCFPYARDGKHTLRVIIGRDFRSKTWSLPLRAPLPVGLLTFANDFQLHLCVHRVTLTLTYAQDFLQSMIREQCLLHPKGSTNVQGSEQVDKKIRAVLCSRPSPTSLSVLHTMRGMWVNPGNMGHSLPTDKWIPEMDLPAWIGTIQRYKWNETPLSIQSTDSELCRGHRDCFCSRNPSHDL